MKFDLGDVNYQEQMELMNILNSFNANNIQNKQSIGFNDDTIYNWIEPKEEK